MKIESLKSTLNLPSTPFAMKANLVNKEPEILKLWDRFKCYQKVSTRKSDDSFILHDGPPYANGDLHIGHAVNKILKDIVVRSQALQGKKVEYRPGWDCHGLPIEIAVEKKYGRGKLNQDIFISKCREFAGKTVAKQKTDFVRMGVIADWKNSYHTMDHFIEADTLKALKEIWKNDAVFRGKKPVHWCTSCRSALAEAEVEYAPHESFAIDVAMNIVDYGMLKKYSKVPTAVIIWTTTPWTLPSNQAVCLGSTISYSLVSNGQIQLLIATDLVETVLKRINLPGDFKELEKFKGMELESKKSYITVAHPLFDRVVPLLRADYVELDVGTGLVHTAPAHGVDDYLTGVRYGLLPLSTIDEAGKFICKKNPWSGATVEEANELIIKHLDIAVLSVEKYTHSYPHCWRHKTPLLFRATPQWFIAIDSKTANAEIGKVQWFPQWGERRISNMVSQRAEWCISRQRSWGVPIPICLNRRTHLEHPKQSKIFDLAISVIREGGVEAWSDQHPKYIELLGKDINKYTLGSDILDVWFDSGVTHHSVMGGRTSNLYLEGSDQHRGWFQSSMLTAVAMGRSAPYLQVVTHGFVVDEHGYKMSKSLGNIISPQKLFKTHGADILRLMIARSDTTSEMKISQTTLEQNSEIYRRIRNTLRYLHSNLYDYDYSSPIPFDELLLIDKWIVLYTNRLKVKLLNSYNSYQFHVCVTEITSFCSTILGSFYLEINKDRLYTGAKKGRARKSAQSAMHYILQSLLKMTSPIIPFTCEELWQIYKKTDKKIPDSVALSIEYEGNPYSDSDFNTYQNQDELFHLFSKLTELKSMCDAKIEEARTQNQIGSSLAAEITIHCDQDSHALFKKYKDELHYIAICSKLDLSCDKQHTKLSAAKVEVRVSSKDKCERCWSYSEIQPLEFADGSSSSLCLRCQKNIQSEDGDSRKYF